MSIGMRLNNPHIHQNFVKKKRGGRSSFREGLKTKRSDRKKNKKMEN